MTYRDYSLNYLGYSTDNGAFYYYQTEDHQPGKRGPPYTPGKTYEETLIDVKHYADSIGVPYKCGNFDMILGPFFWHVCWLLEAPRRLLPLIPQ